MVVSIPSFEEIDEVSYNLLVKELNSLKKQKYNLTSKLKKQVKPISRYGDFCKKNCIKVPEGIIKNDIATHSFISEVIIRDYLLDGLKILKEDVAYILENNLKLQKGVLLVENVRKFFDKKQYWSRIKCKTSSSIVKNLLRPVSFRKDLINYYYVPIYNSIFLIDELQVDELFGNDLIEPPTSHFIAANKGIKDLYKDSLYLQYIDVDEPKKLSASAKFLADIEMKKTFNEIEITQGYNKDYSPICSLLDNIEEIAYSVGKSTSARECLQLVHQVRLIYYGESSVPKCNTCDRFVTLKDDHASFCTWIDRPHEDFLKQFKSEETEDIEPNIPVPAEEEEIAENSGIKCRLICSVCTKKRPNPCPQTAYCPLSALDVNSQFSRTVGQKVKLPPAMATSILIDLYEIIPRFCHEYDIYNPDPQTRYNSDLVIRLVELSKGYLTKRQVKTFEKKIELLKKEIDKP